MPDLIQKHFSYGQLWPLWPECSQNWARSYISHPTFLIQFGSGLPKKARIILCKDSLDPIWMAWSGFGQKHLVRKQAGLQESPDLVLAERNRPATSFPVSDSVAFRWPGSSSAKPAWIWFGSGRLCQVFRFWPNGSSPEASQCARIIRPTSHQHFQANLDRMWNVIGSTKHTVIQIRHLALSPPDTVIVEQHFNSTEVHSFRSKKEKK